MNQEYVHVALQLGQANEENIGFSMFVSLSIFLNILKMVDDWYLLKYSSKFSPFHVRWQHYNP